MKSGSLAILVMIFLSGCASAAKPQAVLFPAQWPSALLPAAVPISATPSSLQPAIVVEPFVREESGPDGVLTELFIHKLRASGVTVAAGPEQSSFLFRAIVPELGYAVRGGYPRKITYFSRMVYQLTHRETGIVIWNGTVGQDFEQTVLVNTMTRLPEDPDSPERILVEKCVEPTWSAIAADLSEFLKKGSH